MSHPHKVLPWGAALLGVLLFAACETRHLTPGGSPERNPRIRIGMNAEEVKAVLGEPHEERAPDPVKLPACVEWRYELRLSAFIGGNAVEINETPYIDPITGEAKVILDPVVRHERKEVERTVFILFNNAKVVGWRVEDHSKRRYD